MLRFNSISLIDKRSRFWKGREEKKLRMGYRGKKWMESIIKVKSNHTKCYKCRSTNLLRPPLRSFSVINFPIKPYWNTIQIVRVINVPLIYIFGILILCSIFQYVYLWKVTHKREGKYPVPSGTMYVFTIHIHRPMYSTN